jgi:hypothetical protein
MNKARCQQISSVENWDDAIAFAEAKIKELKEAIRGFRSAKERGDPWLGRQSDNQTSEAATRS